MAESAKLIDADSLKTKLLQYRRAYIDAWGGFDLLPDTDKARVDELTAIIGAVVNAPTIDATSVVRCKDCVLRGTTYGCPMRH